jgi:hypothetical protein
MATGQDEVFDRVTGDLDANFSVAPHQRGAHAERPDTGHVRAVGALD